jgi:hypothetical protein
MVVCQYPPPSRLLACDSFTSLGGKIVCGCRKIPTFMIMRLQKTTFCITNWALSGELSQWVSSFFFWISLSLSHIRNSDKKFAREKKFLEPKKRLRDKALAFPLVCVAWLPLCWLHVCRKSVDFLSKALGTNFPFSIRWYWTEKKELCACMNF